MNVPVPIVRLHPAGSGPAAPVIARNSAWLTLEFAVGTFSGLVTSVAVAHVLGPAELGYFSYLLWAVTAVSAGASMGVPAATRKFAAEFLGSGDLPQVVSVIERNWRLQGAIASAAAALALLAVFTVVDPRHRWYAIAGALAIAPAMLAAVPTAAAAALQQSRAAVIPSIASGLLQLAAVAVSLAMGWGLPGLAVSFLISRVADVVLRRRAVGGILERIRAPGAPLPIDDRLALRMRRFYWTSGAVTLLNLVVWDRSEVFFLGMFADARQVAFYTVPFNMVTQLLLTTRGFASSASAHLMLRAGTGAANPEASANAIIRYVSIVALPALLGLAALSRPLMAVLFGTPFEGAAPVLAVLAVFALARAVITPVLLMFSAWELQGRALAALACCAAANLLLGRLWIPAGGALGAAAANGVSQLIAIAALWTVLSRKLSMRFDWRGLLPVALASAGAVAPAAACALTLPPWAAVLFGVFTGVLLYPVLLRVTRAVTVEDRRRADALTPLLPAVLRAPAARFLAWMAR